MKAIVETNQLKEAMQKINHIRLTRLQLPILSCVHANFSNGKLILTATDLSKAIRVTIDSKNDGDCTLVFPRKLLERFLYTAKGIQDKNGRIEILQNGIKTQATLKRNKLGNATISVTPEKEFPPIPYVENLDWHTFDGKWLCRMLKIVSRACATEPNRPILGGVVFKDGDIASADGFRLATLKDTKLSFGLIDKKAIVHRDIIATITQLFAKEDKLDIAFELGSDKTIRHIYCKADNVLFMAECIQGTYPNFEMLIPKTFMCKASFSVPLMMQRLNMIDALNIASGITRYTFHKTDPNNEEECLIQADTVVDEGNYYLTTPIKLDADTGKIAINLKYVIEAIKPFSICEWELTSPSSPLKITGNIKGLTIVVMPIFVQW